MGTLNCISGYGRSFSITLMGLNMRECEVRNQKYVMKFCKVVQAYGLSVKILELNPEPVFSSRNFGTFFVVEVRTYGRWC